MKQSMRLESPIGLICRNLPEEAWSESTGSWRDSLQRNESETKNTQTLVRQVLLLLTKRPWLHTIKRRGTGLSLPPPFLPVPTLQCSWCDQKKIKTEISEKDILLF